MTKSEIAALMTIPMSVVHWHFGQTIISRGGLTGIEEGWIAYVKPETKQVVGVARTNGPGSKTMMATMAHFAETEGWTAYRIEA
jgi:hypothetical protein